MQSLNDGIMSVEDQLTALKTKMMQSKTGGKSFKVPSIDSINRTIRTMAIAIADKRRGLDDLIKRTEKLSINNAGSKPSASSLEKSVSATSIPAPDKDIIDRALSQDTRRSKLAAALKTRKPSKASVKEDGSDRYQFTRDEPLSLIDIPSAEAIRKRRAEKAAAKVTPLSTPSKTATTPPTNTNPVDTFSPGSRDSEAHFRHSRHKSDGSSGRQRAVQLPKHSSPVAASDFFAFK